MLSRLSITNYAIIDHLEIDFAKRLNVITGETGAGKSIIVGALGLILGQRAEGNVLLKKEKKCIVEGCFKENAADAEVIIFLQQNELDVAEELTVRREVAPNGKSRAFINDTPVTLLQLNNLSSLLVDLHQQFDTLELGQSDFQREVMDALAATFSTVQKYRNIFLAAQTAKKELVKLTEQKTQAEKEADYHQFQFTELEEAGFKENELEELDIEVKLLSNAEAIKTALAKAYFELAESEEPVVRRLKAISTGVQPFADLHPELPQIIQRLQSAYIELQDVADEVDRINSSTGSDAETLEAINERLSLGYRLLKKHGVSTTNELIAIRDNLNDKLQAVLNIDDAIAAAEKAYSNWLQQAESLAEKISAARKAQVAPLEKQVNKMLAQVGMPNARIKIAITKVALTTTGFDDVVFLFDANKKDQFQPLRKVASGGELSRLMLCIKSLVATSMNMPTLIFDEIDTGISGEAAKQVGVIMKDLASARQVICITHQPQIAGKADAHYFVYKSLEKDAVTTGVRLLDTDERIVAIAKMMSGERPTAAALENAREMVMN